MGPQGSIFITDLYFSSLRRISYPTSFSATVGNSGLAFVEDGTFGHIMKEDGLQTHTTDLSTGRVLLRFHYDVSNRLVSVEDRFSNLTLIERDAGGSPKAIVSPYGLRTGLSIDSKNHLSDVSYPDGSGVHFESTDLGLLTSRVDARGNRFNYTYDGEGKLAQVDDPSGGSSFYSNPGIYTLQGKMLTKTKTPLGIATDYEDVTDSTGAYTGVIRPFFDTTTDLSRSSDKSSETVSTNCGVNVSKEYRIDLPYRYRYLSKMNLCTPLGLEKTVSFDKIYDAWEQVAPGEGNRIPRKITWLSTVNEKTTALENDTTLSKSGRSYGQIDEARNHEDS